jgi:hypothetical protein
VFWPALSLTSPSTSPIPKSVGGEGLSLSLLQAPSEMAKRMMGISPE